MPLTTAVPPLEYYCRHILQPDNLTVTSATSLVQVLSLQPTSQHSCEIRILVVCILCPCSESIRILHSCVHEKTKLVPEYAVWYKYNMQKMRDTKSQTHFLARFPGPSQVYFFCKDSVSALDLTFSVQEMTICTSRRSSKCRRATTRY